MKNYYEILEVDQNASDEIIKVAYKSLVKKYHPDLKEGDEKKIAEEKIKQINKAYDVLSNPNERNEYNNSLNQQNISPEEYNFILNENMQLKKEVTYYKNYFASMQNSNNYSSAQNSNNYSNTSNYNQQAYYTKKKSNHRNIFYYFSDSIKTIIALAITFAVLFLLLKLPFINNMLGNYLGNNSLIIIIVVVLFFYFFIHKH